MTLTPFEASGHTEWTTLEDEPDFYTALSATGRVTVEVLGPASPPRDSRLVRLVTVDTATTPANAPSVLFVGLQHGNEPVGRETILSTIRDLAETSEQEMVALLGRCRFHFIPTANPSAFPDWRAVYGQQGRHPNSHHLSLDLIESEYIQRVITDTDPVAVLDFHEHFAPVDDRFRIEFLPGGHTQGDAEVDALSSDLLGVIQSRLDDLDIEHGLYSPYSVHPWVLRGISSIQGRMFLLAETPAREDIVDRATRFHWFTTARDVILEWFTEHIDAAAATFQGAKDRQAQRVDQFDLTNGTILNPAPSAYLLPAPAPKHFDVFGITYIESGGVVTVPMAQPNRAVIAYLLDPAGPQPVVEAQRVYAPTPPGSSNPIQGIPAAAYLRLDGQVYEVGRAYLRLDGQVYEVPLGDE